VQNKITQLLSELKVLKVEDQIHLLHTTSRWQCRSTVRRPFYSSKN